VALNNDSSTRAAGPLTGVRVIDLSTILVFLGTNRNKRSIVLDLKQDVARQALLRLATEADVFVHNMRPQAIARLGLDYASLAEARADIIYCGSYGFRASGPYGNKAAFDDMIQAASGLAALQNTRPLSTT
jgi:crotonobetainyl-CoA:carnitine CoA-transferase CaiB-like acyl-CoA transferase